MTHIGQATDGATSQEMKNIGRKTQKLIFLDLIPTLENLWKTFKLNFKYS